KLGSPEPGPLLRRYGRALGRADAERLGRAILEAWIVEDTVPMTEAEAQAAAQNYPWMQQTPQATQQLFQTLRSTPRGSATAHKGVLAVAGALAGAEAAALVAQYLKTYYGNRAGQCKALLQMLAWIDAPDA